MKLIIVELVIAEVKDHKSKRCEFQAKFITPLSSPIIQKPYFDMTSVQIRPRFVQDTEECELTTGATCLEDELNVLSLQ